MTRRPVDRPANARRAPPGGGGRELAAPAQPRHRPRGARGSGGHARARDRASGAQRSPGRDGRGQRRRRPGAPARRLDERPPAEGARDHGRRDGRRLRGAGDAGRVAPPRGGRRSLGVPSTRSTAPSTPTWPGSSGRSSASVPDPGRASPILPGRCWAPERGRSRPATSSTAPPPSSSTRRGLACTPSSSTRSTGDSGSRRPTRACRPPDGPTRSTTRTGRAGGPAARALVERLRLARTQGPPLRPPVLGRPGRGLPPDARRGWDLPLPGGRAATRRAHPAPVRGGAARARGGGGGRAREHGPRRESSTWSRPTITSARRSTSAARRR